MNEWSEGTRIHWPDERMSEMQNAQTQGNRMEKLGGLKKTAEWRNVWK